MFFLCPKKAIPGADRYLLAIFGAYLAGILII